MYRLIMSLSPITRYLNSCHWAIQMQPHTTAITSNPRLPQTQPHTTATTHSHCSLVAPIASLHYHCSLVAFSLQSRRTHRTHARQHTHTHTHALEVCIVVVSSLQPEPCKTEPDRKWPKQAKQQGGRIRIPPSSRSDWRLNHANAITQEL